jgi:2-keto-4-pentenoate hydratase/2-oxohepta-3-ene-1,7-dioic acid hydratase in catechol pathway
VIRINKKFNLEEVELLAPCTPSKIFGVGLNFPNHIKELELATPAFPANFLKPFNLICHPYDEIVIPKGVKRDDYEGELAIVVGKKITNANVDQAAEAIFGFTPFNDLTERIISYTSNLVAKSKGFDSSSCYGSIFDTDRNWREIEIGTYLNGEIAQQENTGDMIFSPAEILSCLSLGTTFYPGDVVTTGTPEHVLELHDGDIVEVEIEGIELKLRNPVWDLRKH